jgi:hypothetical protein
MVEENKDNSVLFVLRTKLSLWLNHAIIYVYVNNALKLSKNNLIIVLFVGRRLCHWLL